MEKHMGYQPVQQDRQPRQLPCFDIAGTLFLVDIDKREFRQLDDPHNRMPFGNIQEGYGFSTFLFDTRAKNLYINTADGSNDVPGHVRLVIVPPLKELDPVGLARLHGFSDSYYKAQHTETRTKVLTAFTKSNHEIVKPGKRKGLSKI